jgi:hypothetical protein
MRRLRWSEFVRSHPHADLVAAFVPETERIGTPDARQKLDVLVSRIRQLAPSDVYAVTIVRAGGRAEIHCAFANEADATVFATAMKAKVVRRYPGRASQRPFRLDDAAALALCGALTPASLGDSQRRQGREGHHKP